MALVVADRVKETTTTTGTGTVTLAGASSGFQAFSVIGNANTTYYAIVAQSGTEWEVGLGTYTSAGTLLSRDTVLSSSNAGALVNFSAGTKDVFVTYPAGRSVYQDTAGLVALSGTIQADTFQGGSASITTLSGSSLNFSNVSSSRVDGTNPIGYLNIPVDSRSAAYSLVLSDSGKVIFHPASDANNRTFTIPSSTTVAFPLGTVLTFSNLATTNPVTIAIITDTLYLAGTGSTGSRTLGAYGIAQCTKVALGIWLLTGTGVS